MRRRLGATTATAENGALVFRCRIRRGLPLAAVAVARTAVLRVALGHVRSAGRRPEIVHAHVFATGLYAVPLARALRAPLVITEHESAFAFGPFTALDKWVAARAFGAADLVTTVCDHLRRAIEAVGIRGPFVVIPNVVDTEMFSPSGAVGTTPPGSRARLVIVAGLVELKGIQHALRALRELTADATVDIVGDGPCRVQLEELAATLGVTDRVRWHGIKQPERIAELMRSASLYVLPSEFDNLPTVLLESLCCGLPVVATRVGGVPEIVEHGDGLLVAARDPHALAAAISDALATRWDRAAIASRAAARYGPTRLVPRWEALYGDLIEARRG